MKERIYFATKKDAQMFKHNMETLKAIVKVCYANFGDNDSDDEKIFKYCIICELVHDMVAGKNSDEGYWKD